MMRQKIQMMISKGILLLVAPLLVACASSSVPDHYYLLSPMFSSSAPVSGSTAVVGVGPVTIPSYLDRATIVTRSSANRPEINSGYRWAEPLGENINRVLMDNLERAGIAERLEMFPWTSRDLVEWQIVVDIDRFERQSDGDIHLVARWKLVHFESGQIARAAKYDKKLPAPDASIEGTVIAMSSLLADLTGEMVAEMN